MYIYLGLFVVEARNYFLIESNLQKLFPKEINFENLFKTISNKT